MKLSILVAFLLLLAVTNAYPTNSESGKTKSWFTGLKSASIKFAHKRYFKCSGIECPDYELKKKTDDYELRCYSNLSIVYTKYEVSVLSRDVKGDERVVHISRS